MTHLENDVLKRARSGDPVALCQVMVAIPSVNPELEKDGAGEGDMARVCAAWLREWGYQLRIKEISPGRWNVIASRVWGPGGRTLVLNGHLDTVGITGMAADPFSAELKEGRVWGRGSCDMKGGLAVILATASNLASGLCPGGRPAEGELIIALTADEEHASVGMQDFVGKGLQAHGAVVCEPTNLAVMPAHKGFLWIEADFRGRAAHGSRPEEGVDAIMHAGRFLSGLTEMSIRLGERPPHPLLATPSFHAGTISGGSAPSVYPEECSLIMERRTLPGEDPNEILREFEEVLGQARREVPDLNASLRAGLFRPGTEVPLESDLVQGLMGALNAEGREGRVEGMTAWVDAAFLNGAGVPAVCFGPGSIAQAHALEEWVSVAELQDGARVLSRFGCSFLQG